MFLNKAFFRSVMSIGAISSLVACSQPPAETPDTPTESVDCDGGLCILSGTITEDLTLTADRSWLLRGGVFIGNDIDETVLTIEPGTQIFGETSTRGMLVITRGSKILAEGTAEEPIVMTSSKAEGERARGDWGGLIINGRAPVNGCDETPCESYGEGGTGYYGGDQTDDSSGTLKYVRVEFAGQLVSPDNELNGIAFQGVGSGTEVDYIQVHMGADDGVEFFGGTVNAKHILLTGIADDNVDWTDGWTGKLQFVAVQQYEDAGDNGIEADNNGEDNASLPRSAPVLSNVTLVGSPESSNSDIGILLREGTGANLHNFIVTGFNDVGIDIDHAETFANALSGNAEDGYSLSGNLTIENSIFDNETNFDVDEDEADEPLSVESFVLELNNGNVAGLAGLRDPFVIGVNDLRPANDSIATSGAVVPNDAFFDQVNYKGAFAPDSDWTEGWTVSYRN